MAKLDVPVNDGISRRLHTMLQVPYPSRVPYKNIHQFFKDSCMKLKPLPWPGRHRSQPSNLFSAESGCRQGMDEWKKLSLAE
jgi:hypothetical protein